MINLHWRKYSSPSQNPIMREYVNPKTSKITNSDRIFEWAWLRVLQFKAKSSDRSRCCWFEWVTRRRRTFSYKNNNFEIRGRVRSELRGTEKVQNEWHEWMITKKTHSQFKTPSTIYDYILNNTPTLWGTHFRHFSLFFQRIWRKQTQFEIKK